MRRACDGFCVSFDCCFTRLDQWLNQQSIDTSSRMFELPTIDIAKREPSAALPWTCVLSHAQALPLISVYVLYVLYVECSIDVFVLQLFQLTALDLSAASCSSTAPDSCVCSTSLESSVALFVCSRLYIYIYIYRERERDIYIYIYIYIFTITTIIIIVI